MTTDTTYNGWKNKETWLVKIWYMDRMRDYYADMDQYHVEPNELEEAVTYIAEECEALSSLEVDWRSLADHLNDTLKETERAAAFLAV